MAGRKYKPALYELLDRGRLTPDREGAMGAPRWFHGRKKAAGDPKPAPLGDKPDAPTGFAPSVPHAQTENSDEPRRVEFSVTRRTMLLAGLGVTFAFLLVFMLGQGSVTPPEQGERNQQQQATLAPTADNLKNIPVRNNIYPDKPAIRKPTNTRQDSTVNDVRPKQTAGRQAPTANAAGVDNKRLLLCNYGEPGMLLPVKSHFDRNGMATEIVKTKGNGKYWLVTMQRFNRLDDADGLRLKQRAVRIGSAYNGVRPKTALGFGAKTFESAFPVNREDIEQVFYK